MLYAKKKPKTVTPKPKGQDENKVVILKVGVLLLITTKS